MMKKLKFIAAILAMALMLAACGNNNEAGSTNDVAPAETQAATEQPAGEDNAADAQTSAYPMTISSTVGSTENEEKGTITFEDVTLEKMPEKIVVFDYGFLDTLDALGVEGIVGVAKGANGSSLPSHLQKFSADEYVNAGSLKGPLFEDIAELQPDVIFISGRQSAFYEELKEIAPVVFVGTQQNDYWNTFLSSVDVAAKMFGKEAEAAKYLAEYDAKLAEVKTLAGNFKTSLVTMYNEGKLSGFNTDSRFGYMYSIYGFTPVTEDIQSSSHGSNFGYEAILEFNPEVIFVIDRTVATDTSATSNIEADMNNDIMKRTTAHQNNRIVYLDGPLWYTGGGGLTSELAKINEVLAELK